MNASALTAGLIAAISIGWGARRLARILVVELGLGPFAGGTLTAAIGTGVFLSAVAFVGRRAHSFDAGLWAAAVVGVLMAGGARLLGAPREAELPRADRKVLARVLAVTALLLLLYAHLAFKYQMHDEHALFGHKSMVEQLRRGTYPVYFPPMPEHEARYHYGFDILAGVLTRGLDLSSDNAIDLITLLAVLFMCWSAAAVAVDAGAERSAPLGVLAIHLGAGLAAVMLAGDPGRHPRCLAQFHHPSCNQDLYPTQIMNVFQHPVSLGVPMFLAMVILLPRIAGYVTREDPAPVFMRRAWWLAAAVAVPALAGLALSQVVYFGLGCLGALAALPLWMMRRRPRMPYLVGPLAFLAVLGLGYLLAHALGGMMADHPSVDPTLLARRPVIGFPAKMTPAQIVSAHLANLGLAFALLPVFAVVALRDRRPQVLMLLAFACGGILAAQLYNYQRSWDIVKFPSAASFALSMLYVVVVDRVLVSLPFPWTWLRRAGAALLMITGVTTAIFVAVPLPGANMKLYDDTKEVVDERVQKTIDWWRSHDYRDDQVVYAQKNIATQLSIYGGLSTVGSDTDFYYLGIQMKELTRREWLARRIRQRMDADALEQLGVAYVMLSDEEIRNLGPEAQRAIASGERLELAYTVADPAPGKRRRIWRVRTTPKSSVGETTARPDAR